MQPEIVAQFCQAGRLWLYGTNQQEIGNLSFLKAGRYTDWILAAAVCPQIYQAVLYHTWST
jgi:hypothetical protein